MPYSKFTLSKAVDDFHLTIVEGGRFLPETAPITPTPLLQEILKETLPWAIAVGSEKARSEGIINPVLLEVKRQLKGQISAVTFYTLVELTLISSNESKSKALPQEKTEP